MTWQEPHRYHEGWRLGPAPHYFPNLRRDPAEPPRRHWEYNLALRRNDEQRNGDMATGMQHENEYEQQEHNEREEDRDRHRDRHRVRHQNHNGGRERENPFAPMFAPSTSAVEEAKPAKPSYRTFGPPPNQRSARDADFWGRTSMPDLSIAAALMAQPPQPYAGYVPEVNRPRGPQRGDSMEQRLAMEEEQSAMEQRLAERLSEKRPERRSIGPSPPARDVRSELLNMRYSPTDAELAEILAMDPARAIAENGVVGWGAVPRTSFYDPIPVYHGPETKRDYLYHHLGVIPAGYGPKILDPPELTDPRRGSRRSGEERERPRSSTLAGLTGYGRGAHRVSEWRNFVVPGFPNEAE